MTSGWKIEFFGWLRLEQEDRIITRFRTQKTAVLLAYLAYYRDRSHPREELINMLWPDCDPEAGRRSLSVALSSLRHQMEPPGVTVGAVIAADRISIRLNSALVMTDVADFESALQRASQTGDDTAQGRLLTEAADLYRGEFLPGFYEDWVLAERERLAESLLGALQRLIAHLESEGDFKQAIAFACRALGADPLREQSYRDLMHLYRATGRHSTALRQYNELKRILREELDIAPNAESRKLADEIMAERQTAGETQDSEISTDADAEGDMSITAGPRRPFSSIRAPQTLVIPPFGTVTFLLLDIQDSSALRQQGEEALKQALEAYDKQTRKTIQKHGGQVVREAGEVLWAAFARASDAIAAAIESHQWLDTHHGSSEPGMIQLLPLRARSALHTGEVGSKGEGFFGSDLDHAARLLAATHGGQLLCSEATAALLSHALEPGPRLIDLGIYRLRGVENPERLFQVNYPGVPERKFPPPAAEHGYSGTLPFQVTRFFGREPELAELQEIVLGTETRLVTITGPGGTGKTRLSLESARRLLAPLQGAVWFVPLAEIRDPDLIIESVLDAIGMQRTVGVEPVEQVVEASSRQPALLVLDNFEHLVTEGAPVIQALLERAALLKCMVTSRRLLNLEGEREFPLSPLPPPEETNSPEQLVLNASVRLFLDRAQAVRPDFQVTKRNASAVAQLCRRLEGIPLALELAAARAQVLTSAQMLARSVQRFDLLVSRQRGIAARHRTMRAAVDWSYQLLTPELQKFFARLSVFRGGWTLEAVEAVCEVPSALDLLTELRECSIIQGRVVEAEMRFQMLETMREFAMEGLDSDERARLERRHAEYYLALAERANLELRGPEQVAWLNRLSADHDNLRAALEWSKSNVDDEETGLRFGYALWRFWYARGHLSEGRKQLADVLALTSEHTIARAKALNIAGAVAYYESNLVAARTFYEESLTIHRELGDKQNTAFLLNNLACVADDQGDYARARPLYEEAIALYREIGDQWGIANSLLNLGTDFYSQGDIATARSLYEESLDILNQLGDKFSIAHLLLNLGDALKEESDLVGSRTAYEEALALYRELEHANGIADCLDRFGRIAYEEGDYDKARSLFEEALAIRIELEGRQGLILSLESFGVLALAEGKAERSARLFGAAAALRKKIGIPLPPTEQRRQDKYLDALHRLLSEKEYASAWQSGEALDWEKATAYLLEETGETGS